MTSQGTFMRGFALSLFLFLTLALSAGADDRLAGDLDLYRTLVSKVRTTGKFQIPMPSGSDLTFNYRVTTGTPLYTAPATAEFPLTATAPEFFRMFWDKVLYADGSYIEVGGEQIPLTCLYVAGQDNRYSGNTSPLVPEFVLKVYLVANDFTCTGPINPNWPGSSPRMETWDTYIYYEIRDPTIMLPTEVHLRFRWNEFSAVLVNP
jgi:hypothetical protein